MPAGPAWSGGEELRSELAAERTDLLGAVHEQRSDEPPVLREVPSRQRGLISVEDDSLPSLWGAYVLKPETELVGPEVVSRSGLRRCTEDRAGDNGGLSGRARPVFETYVARMLGAPWGGDVTTGVDVREPCAAAFVCLDWAGGAAQEFTGGVGADGDEDEVALDSVPSERRRPRSVPSFRRRTLSTPAPSLRSTSCSR